VRASSLFNQLQNHRLKVNRIKPSINKHLRAFYGLSPIKVKGIVLSRIFILSLGQPKYND